MYWEGLGCLRVKKWKGLDRNADCVNLLYMFHVKVRRESILQFAGNVRTQSRQATGCKPDWLATRRSSQRCKQRSSVCRCVAQRELCALRGVLSAGPFDSTSHAGNVVTQAALRSVDSAAEQAADTAAAAVSAVQADLSHQSAVLLISAQLVSDLSTAICEVSALTRQDPQQQQHHDSDGYTAIAGLVSLSPLEVQDLLCPPLQPVADCHSSSKASALLRGLVKHGTQGDSHDTLNTVRRFLEEDAQAAMVELRTIKQQLDRV